jgi:LmbE family N-acetylglucosaminyl deacetylase
VLGIPESNLHIFDFPTRSFPQYRQEILQTMIDLRNEIKPGLILAPSINDVHQDHATICREAVRCFKKNSILCYEEPWNNIVFSTNCFIRLEERHVENKIKALSCYESQGHRTYITPEAIRSLAITRGAQLEGGFAEAFEVVRWML